MEEKRYTKDTRDTIIISAFPASGKTTCFETLKDKYKMLDSDSSNFSWIWENGKKTDNRNPDFPENYIKHIKDNIGKYDFIFVSSHKVVRDSLNANGINYVSVFPENTSGNRTFWAEKMYARGNSNDFINFINNNWDNMLEEMSLDAFPVQYILGYKGNSFHLDEGVLKDIIALKQEQDSKAHNTVETSEYWKSIGAVI